MYIHEVGIQLTYDTVQQPTDHPIYTEIATKTSNPTTDWMFITFIRERIPSHCWLETLFI
jgi:hypothetical protein